LGETVNESGFLAAGKQSLDLRQEHLGDRLLAERPDEFPADDAVRTDEKSLRHAIDAPVDRRPAAVVDADGSIGIAELPEEAPGIFGNVLVVDAQNLDPLVAGKPRQKRMLLAAGRTP
jgi:hypothetical protein